MHMNGLRCFLALAIVTAAACSGQKEAAPSAPPVNAKRVDQSKAGNVSGRVTIEGTVPANPPIKLDGDPYCSQQNPKGANLESFVVDNGGLDNVFVYVKDGLGDYGFDVPSDLVSTLVIPATCITLRTGPPAITPVPSGAGFSKTCAEP